MTARNIESVPSEAGPDLDGVEPCGITLWLPAIAPIAYSIHPYKLPRPSRVAKAGQVIYSILRLHSQLTNPTASPGSTTISCEAKIAE